MKKALLFGALFATVFSMQVFAADMSVTVDSKEIKFSEGAEPFIDEGTTFVPLRGVFEKMGYTVVWDAENQQAILKGKDESDIIVVTDDSSIAKVAGVEVDLGVSVRNVNGSLMLPLRAVTEVAGGNIEWDAETKTASIKTKSAIAKEEAQKAKEAAKASSDSDKADKQKAAEDKALEEARAAAKAAEDAAEADKNYDYTAYPTRVLEIADTLDAKLSEAYSVAERSYVNNADVIVPYSDRIEEYIKEVDTEVKSTTVKDAQKKVQTAFNNYYTLAKKSASLIKGASSASYSGSKLKQSTKKGDRSMGSMDNYRKFVKDYTKNEKEVASAKEELKEACEAYIASLG